MGLHRLVGHAVDERLEVRSRCCVDHVPQRREVRHVTTGEAAHGAPDPGTDLVAAVHGAGGVFDVEHVVGVVLDPAVPVVPPGGVVHGSFEFRERVGQFVAGEGSRRRLRHASN